MNNFFIFISIREKGTSLLLSSDKQRKEDKQIPYYTIYILPLNHLYVYISD